VEKGETVGTARIPWQSVSDSKLVPPIAGTRRPSRRSRRVFETWRGLPAAATSLRPSRALPALLLICLAQWTRAGRGICTIAARQVPEGWGRRGLEGSGGTLVGRLRGGANKQRSLQNDADFGKEDQVYFMYPCRWAPPWKFFTRKSSRHPMGCLEGVIAPCHFMCGGLLAYTPVPGPTARWHLSFRNHTRDCTKQSSLKYPRHCTASSKLPSHVKEHIGGLV